VVSHRASPALGRDALGLRCPAVPSCAPLGRYCSPAAGGRRAWVAGLASVAGCITVVPVSRIGLVGYRRQNRRITEVGREGMQGKGGKGREGDKEEKKEVYGRGTDDGWRG
jgi:hypothetical protein